MRRPLLISHDLSYSGAPVALLALAKALQRLGENPAVAPLADGPLRAKFLESGIEIATRVDRASVSLVIANTVVSVPAALRFKRPNTPIAAWIHESAYFFRVLNIAPQECGLRNLDFVLGPAKFQLDELEPFLPPGSAYQLRNTVHQDSFRPPGDESIFSVCGQWEARKGQAQLLDLARRSAVNCRFKFIGAERPAAHAAVEAPQSRHIFLGAMDPDKARMEIATSGALVSCAEAEVQPLSAIEALMAGRPVLLSDIEAHRVLANLVPNVFLFDRKSPQSFLEGYSKLRDAVPNENLANKASAAAKALFGTEAFDRRLTDIMKVLRGQLDVAGTIEHYQDT
jgi:glycosyltransferase involved in cell wall biosynthesis